MSFDLLGCLLPLPYIQGICDYSPTPKICYPFPKILITHPLYPLCLSPSPSPWVSVTPPLHPMCLKPLPYIQCIFYTSLKPNVPITPRLDPVSVTSTLHSWSVISSVHQMYLLPLPTPRVSVIPSLHEMCLLPLPYIQHVCYSFPTPRYLLPLPTLNVFETPPSYP